MYVIVTSEVLNAQKAQLRAIKKVESTSEFYKAKLAGAQRLARLTLLVVGDARG